MACCIALYPASSMHAVPSMFMNIIISQLCIEAISDIFHLVPQKSARLKKGRTTQSGMGLWSELLP